MGYLKQQLSVSQRHKKALKKNLWSEFRLGKNLHASSYYFSSNTYIYEVFPVQSFLNEKPFLFKKSNSPLCSFCKEEDETVFHFYFTPNTAGLCF